jgi:hypothetical protein
MQAWGEHACISHITRQKNGREIWGTQVRNLALPAQKAGKGELLALWAGQSANLARSMGLDELLQSLVEGASERLDGRASGVAFPETNLA